MSNEKVSDAEVLEAMGITTSKNEENPEDVEMAKKVLEKATSDQSAKARKQLEIETFDMGGSVDDLGYTRGETMKESQRGPIKYAVGGAIKGKNFRGSF